jgi:hypothetical protein
VLAGGSGQKGAGVGEAKDAAARRVWHFSILRLRRPVKILVVDHAEKTPAEN